MTDTAVPVPDFVRERWPNFDPEDPATYPEPDACTDGRPYGLNAYGGWVVRNAETVALAWRSYTAWLDEDSPRRWAAPCRNRAKPGEPEHLCGTHLNVYRKHREAAERRRRTDDRLAANRELARDLAGLGYETDATAAWVQLTPDSARALVRALRNTNPEGA